jgi:hypothetical protein
MVHVFRLPYLQHVAHGVLVEMEDADQQGDLARCQHQEVERQQRRNQDQNMEYDLLRGVAIAHRLVGVRLGDALPHVDHVEGQVKVDDELEKLRQEDDHLKRPN